MTNTKILWVDDEIDMLKSHILFLTEKGYHITGVKSGNEAIDEINSSKFDIIFLDENMPGISGLELIPMIRKLYISTPIVMITKSEEESIMEDAIGENISDYLIKPINPNQILLCLKNNLDKAKFITQKTTLEYQREFRQISMGLMSTSNFEDWEELYKKIVYWELKLDNTSDKSIINILESQKNEANNLFCKFIENNYSYWLKGNNSPILSHNAFKKLVFPKVNDSEKFILLMIDNLRYDQWKIIEPIVNELYHTVKETNYYSILPTTTQYSRNAFFAGLMPSEIKKLYPEFWVEDTQEEGFNFYEKELLANQLKRNGDFIKFSYNKITTLEHGQKLCNDFNNLLDNSLNVIVYNFIDMLSHAKTNAKIIKELAKDDKSYRDTTLSWFKNSSLLDIIKLSAQYKLKLFITTDHGTINVKKPSQVIGEKDLSTNLRCKNGKQMSYNKKDVLEINNPKDYYLPLTHINTSYIFAKNDLFFAYKNNYNHYVKYYKNTYQHGGISMEEMIIPMVELHPK